MFGRACSAGGVEGQVLARKSLVESAERLPGTKPRTAVMTVEPARG
jgi:hypothetical protein